MSRIGKTPVAIPAGVTVTVNGKDVTVKGPKGTLSRNVTGPIDVTVDADAKMVTFVCTQDDKYGKAQHGLWRSLVANMVTGVTEGYKKILEIVGVGYRGDVQGAKLSLHLGFAAPCDFVIPADVTVSVEKPTRPGIHAEVHVSGLSNESVGQFAAKVRKVKPPNPYHGKGIRYRDEYVRKLAGKSFGSGA